MPRESGRPPVGNRPDPLDRAGTPCIDHGDTDLLRRFVSDRGRIRSRRVAGVSARRQRRPARP